MITQGPRESRWWTVGVVIVLVIVFAVIFGALYLHSIMNASSMGGL